MPRTPPSTKGRQPVAQDGLEEQAAALTGAFVALAQATQGVPDHASADRTAASDTPKGDAKSRRDRYKITGKLLADLERCNRKQLLPHYATTALVSLAAAVHDMAAQANALGTAALVTALAAGVGGTVGQLLLRRQRELAEQWATWSAMLSTATGIWLVAAVASGVDWTLLGAALAVEQAFGARWWRHHRHPDPTAPVETVAEAAPLQIDESQIALYARRWGNHVGGKDGVLPGSSLIDGTPFEHGIEYLLRLRPGKQSIDSVRSAMAMVASGLGIPQSKLVVEEHESDNPALLTFRIVTASPVAGDVYFRAPEYDDGRILLGPYVDGIGDATWRLYTEDSMWGGMVIGGTGSGKSRLLEVIGLVAMFTGVTYVIHVDGQDGSSCPALWEHAHERYGQDDVEEFLARVAAIQRERQQHRPAGVTGFTPTAERPGVLVIVDEAHVVITSQTVDRWASLAREARKVGIGVVMGDQDGSLETFKKAVLRGSLRAGNAVGLKTEERTQGQIVANGKFNLYDLPAIAGFGHTLGDGARHAPYRGKWLPSRSNAAERARKGKPLPQDLLLVEDWYQRAPRLTLDAPSQRASDKAATAVKRRGGQGGSSSGVATATNVIPMQSARPGSRVPPLPTVGPPPAAAPTPAAPAAPTPPAPTLTAIQAAVLQAVEHGYDQPGAIANHLGVSRQHVGTALAALIDLSYLTKSGNGPAVRYQVAEKSA